MEKFNPILKGWFGSLLAHYQEYKTQNHNCKIVRVEIEESNNQLILHVLMRGIKSQIVPYKPEELILDDSILEQFSASDVRAITYLSLKDRLNEIAIYNIIGQDFENGKTIFVIHTHEKDERKYTAEELYDDNELLKKFNYIDVKNIITTAIQEQAIQDFTS